MEISEKETKSVKWKDEQTNDKYEELKNMLKNFMEKITTEIKEIREEIKEMKNMKKQESEENNSIEL